MARSWVFNSVSSHHICSNRKWFHTFEKNSWEDSNGFGGRVEGIGAVKVKLHDGTSKILGNVFFVPESGKNLISLRMLGFSGYRHSDRDGVLRIKRGNLIVMKGLEVYKHFYMLMGTTIVEDEDCKSLDMFKSGVTERRDARRRVSFAGYVREDKYNQEKRAF